jgi:hypothetical protein
MRSIRLLFAGVILVVAACASPAGVWTGSYDNLDRSTLREEVEKTLRADQWVIVAKGDTLEAVKKDGGGHQTGAFFNFADAGKGSSFELNGKSGHVVNWLTFGILGAAMKAKAAHSCSNFIETFEREHPRPK